MIVLVDCLLFHTYKPHGEQSQPGKAQVYKAMDLSRLWWCQSAPLNVRKEANLVLRWSVLTKYLGDRKQFLKYVTQLC